MEQDEKKQSRLAGQIMRLAQDDILMHLRFLDLAISKLPCKERKGLGGIATDGEVCYYDPKYVLLCYCEEPGLVTRIYLHTLFHCIFSHQFLAHKVETKEWNLAVDIAVEHVIQNLKLSGVSLKEEERIAEKLSVLKGEISALTAEKIYRYLQNNPLPPRTKAEYDTLFTRDLHSMWQQVKEPILTKSDWMKISERIKADLKAFTKGKTGTETLEKNLEETTRDRYDYSEILQRFVVSGEDLTVNEDEFDYIYYTYGLREYGNLPLIEPLEYKETKKVKEFVIAIDTSASCRGAIVKAFLRKTYSILKGSENYFHRVNIHIVQCDSEVQSDTKIVEPEDFEEFMRYGKLSGFGATDFRPVFTYVEALQAAGEFENLKGLIYFTDGYGIYPEKMPDYQVMFAFLEEDDNRAPVPPWSMKVILEEEQLEEREVPEGETEG